ncbi:MAG: hypothetical protein MI922_22880 [Bacteroidales bacterium]|nr:hypothetical protein [Bacteroidales bacterium]
MAFNFSKLEKLTIVSYPTVLRTGNGEKFTAMFNPESYSLFYQNVYDQKQGINSTGRPSSYHITKPEKLNLKLILDGTGVDNTGFNNMRFGVEDVYQKVQRFLDITTIMDGKIHEPRYLTLKWGDLVFKCRLMSVNVNYSLFNSSGIPLRAELDTVFFGDLEKSERLKKNRKSSPDLTHYRVVREHDKLPLMCKEIYGSSQYYISVAKANNLDDFRNLKPGMEIYFPPIEK